MIGSIQANPQYIKYLNKRKVLHFVKDNQAQSRSEIAKELNISKPTVSKIVDELLSENWITEQESSLVNPLGGRKARKLHFNKNACYLIGVDIGGTTVELALFNVNGEMLNKIIFGTQETIIEKTFIKVLVSHIKKLIEKSGLQDEHILGIGIGVPGMTNVDKGIVVDAPSLAWKDYHLKHTLEALLPFSVYIDNDVNVAVLGEQWKGAGKNKENILKITLGTGIGCGMIINGHLYRGSSYAAGEIGYIITEKSLAETTYDSIFTGYGFLDNHVGGPSITNRMLKYLGKDGSNAEDWSAKKIMNMAKNGDDMALKVVKEAFSHLTFALINVITIVNPECIILGGGLSKSMDFLLPEIVTNIEKHLPMKTEISITKLEDVSLLGAASLLLKEHESILKL